MSGAPVSSSSLSTSASDGAPDADPLQAYLDGLLPIDDQTLPPIDDQTLLPIDDQTLPPHPAAAGADAADGGYWLVTAGGLTLALPADEVSPLEPRNVDAGLCEIDVGLVVAARPAPRGQPGRYLRPRRYPDHLLRVDAVSQRVDIDEARIRRRRTTQPRPWLAGLVESPAAALLSVADLVRERHGAE